MFGEYGIIKGSRGFAFPFKKYCGVLEFASSCASIDEKLRLHNFFSYIKHSNALSKELDMSRLESDIRNGLFFNSNIPYGYGIGSSGALCAAIYAEYSHHFSRKVSYEAEELSFLQDQMALMESYYHGTSSGVDCLISLLDKPVIIKSRNNLEIVEMPKIEAFGDFFLFESNMTRKTSPLVHDFLSRYDCDLIFKNKVQALIEFTNQAIKNLYSSDKKDFQSSFHQISQLQLEYFSKMIPESIKQIWAEGLNSGEFFMKLCGAGGGGYFLVYSPHNRDLSHLDLIKLSR